MTFYLCQCAVCRKKEFRVLRTQGKAPRLDRPLNGRKASLSGVANQLRPLAGEFPHWCVLILQAVPIFFDPSKIIHLQSKIGAYRCKRNPICIDNSRRRHRRQLKLNEIV